MRTHISKATRRSSRRANERERLRPDLPVRHSQRGAFRAAPTLGYAPRVFWRSGRMSRAYRPRC